MRYRAFISYSHADERWAGWLHRAIETYRVPRRLRGTAGRYGEVPRSLFPVFRDRDELSSASDLSLTIQAALSESAALVVICSPRAAASRWVDQEIQLFQALGRGDRVLCLIVDGEPGATDATACFPPALRTQEPLAADVRPGKDGREGARLKLIAGLLGVGYAELRRRELQRARRRMAFNAAAVAGTCAAVALAYVATADAGLEMPGGAAIRSAIDGHDASLFRPAHPLAQDTALAGSAATALLARLDREWRAGLWMDDSPTRPVGPHHAINVWIAGQAACAAFRALPPGDARAADFFAAVAKAFEPGIAVEAQGVRFGWFDSVADFPQAEPGLWLVAALAAGLARPDVPEATRTQALAELDYAQGAADTYRPTGDGGWNMFARQDDPAAHSAYSTTLALLALLELRRAHLGWHGDTAARDAMLAATVAWLGARFEPDAVPPGWHGGTTDAGPIADGLTLQIEATLLRAEAEAGIAVPPAVLAALPAQIDGLGERTMSYAYTATRFIRAFSNVDGAHVARFQDVRYLWHPWAIDLAWRWQARLARTGAPEDARVRAQRVLGHLMVDIGAPAFADEASSPRDVFIASETLLTLSDLLPPREAEGQ
jgi:hypothetical protein